MLLLLLYDSSEQYGGGLPEHLLLCKFLSTAATGDSVLGLLGQKPRPSKAQKRTFLAMSAKQPDIERFNSCHCVASPRGHK